MFIFIAWQNAEAGRFSFTLADLAKLREPLIKALAKLNNMVRQVQATPDGQAKILRLTSLLDHIRPAHVGPTLSGEITMKLPKGLRVEDLKPPPAKRQKGATGRPSPSQGSGSTPEAAKTSADSPSDTSADKGPTGKRKRKASTLKTPSQPVEEVKVKSPTPQEEIVVVPDLPTDVEQFAQTFADAEAIRDPPMDDATSEAFWDTLQRTILESVGDGEATGTAGATGATDQARAAEEDWFDQFIDIPQADEGVLPTPELFNGYQSDTSPESVKTVGAKTPLASTVTEDDIGKGTDSQYASDKPARERIVVLGGPNSPERQAYNGTIYGEFEDEDTFDFGVPAPA